MTSFGILCRVAFEWIEVSEECIASIIRVNRISELGTTLTVFHRNTRATQLSIPEAVLEISVSLYAPVYRNIAFTDNIA
jgi:hypothetical protein